MCGLCGSITKRKHVLNPKELKQRKAILQGLLVANASRGRDSTGIATIDKGTCQLFKDVKDAPNFLKIKETQKLLSKDSEVIIGHTRQATTGAVTPENAHPFIVDRIVGTHNGWLSNYLEFNHTVQVDSEVIFKELDQHKNDFQKVFKKLNGVFALAWYDLSLGKLHLARGTNPLSVALVPSLKTYFWSSEVEHLETVIYSVLGEKVDFTLFEIEANRVYTFSPDLQIKKTKIEFGKAATPNWQNWNANDLEEEDYQVDWKLDACEIASEEGCSKCAKPIYEGFYFCKDSFTVLCNNCIKLESRKYNAYSYITKEEFYNGSITDY